MDIKGKCKIYGKEFNGRIVYSTYISQKNQNGEWEKMYIQVQLPKDTILDNGTEINITKGFLSFYNGNEGQKLKYVVREFELDSYEQEEREAMVNEQDYIEQDDDLPF
jgi:hypothetical protein